jgi:hypothetical protein
MSVPDPHQLGDGPVEDRYIKRMEFLAHQIDAVLNPSERTPRDVGFVLLVFPFGETEGRCNYVSNGADRSDVATMLEEQAKRFREIDAT